MATLHNFPLPGIKHNLQSSRTFYWKFPNHDAGFKIFNFCWMWKLLPTPPRDDTRPQRSGKRTSGSNKFKHIFIFVNPRRASPAQPAHRDKTFYYKTFYFIFWVGSCQTDFMLGDLANSIIELLNSCYFDIFPRTGTGLPIYFRILQHFDIITSSLLRIPLWKSELNFYLFVR